MKSQRENALSLEYPYSVTRQGDGTFFIEFLDLPGCFTQVADAKDIASAAEEIRELWIETELDRGNDIPEPSAQADYSGRFIARIPKSLHRDLVRAAKVEGCSLNQFIVYLLAGREVSQRTNRELEEIREGLLALQERLPYLVVTSRASHVRGDSLRRDQERVPVAA